MAPMFGAISLPLPSTPRLNEPMSRRKRPRNCAPMGVTPAGGAGVVSVKISAAAGGEVKSLRLSVNVEPKWQLAQPAAWNRSRPVAIVAAETPRPGRRLVVNGACGVRTANRTHSRMAVRAGTATVLPGSVTVHCGRSALGLAKALSTHGASVAEPLSPSSSPWAGSSALVGGGGSLQACAAASGPGPETLRMFASKSSTSSKIAE